MYLFSKLILSLLDAGIMKLPSINDKVPKIMADIIKGLNKRLKLILLFNIAIISELLAIFEVKNITEIKINRGLKRFPK
jgi:hypothetical protein